MSHDEIERQHREAKRQYRQVERRHREAEQRREDRASETRANVSRLAAGAMAGAGAVSGGKIVAKAVHDLSDHINELKAATARQYEISQEQLEIERQRLGIETNEQHRRELILATKDDLYQLRKQLDSILEEESNVVRRLKALSTYSNINDQIDDLTNLLDDFNDKEFASNLAKEWEQSIDSTACALSDTQDKDVNYYLKLEKQSFDIWNKHVLVHDECNEIQAEISRHEQMLCQVRDDLKKKLATRDALWLAMVFSGVIAIPLILWNIGIALFNHEVPKLWPNMCMLLIFPSIVLFLLWVSYKATKEEILKITDAQVSGNTDAQVSGNPRRPLDSYILMQMSGVATTAAIRRGKDKLDACLQKHEDLSKLASRATKAANKFLQKYPTSADLIENEIFVLLRLTPLKIRELTILEEALSNETSATSGRLERIRYRLSRWLPDGPG